MLGMNPKQMQTLFRQLGIKTREINAVKVTIKTDSGDIEIENPKVTEIDMKGTKMYQISGDTVEKKFSEEDIKFVMENTGVNRERAERALKETEGDIAKAIMRIKSE